MQLLPTMIRSPRQVMYTWYNFTNNLPSNLYDTPSQEIIAYLNDGENRSNIFSKASDSMTTPYTRNCCMLIGKMIK